MNSIMCSTHKQYKLKKAALGYLHFHFLDSILKHLYIRIECLALLGKYFKLEPTTLPTQKNYITWARSYDIKFYSSYLFLGYQLFYIVLNAHAHVISDQVACMCSLVPEYIVTHNREYVS